MMAVALALLVGLCDAIQTANGKTPTGRMHRWGSDASCRLSGDDIDGDAFIQQSGGSVSAAYLQTALGKARRIIEAAHTASANSVAASGNAVKALEKLTTTIQLTGRPITASAFTEEGKSGDTCKVVFEPILLVSSRKAISYGMDGMNYKWFPPSGCGKGEVCVIDRVKFISWVPDEDEPAAGSPSSDTIGTGTCENKCVDGKTYKLDNGKGEFCIRSNTIITHDNYERLKNEGSFKKFLTSKEITWSNTEDPLAVHYKYFISDALPSVRFHIYFPGHKIYDQLRFR